MLQFYVFRFFTISACWVSQLYTKGHRTVPSRCVHHAATKGRGHHCTYICGPLYVYGFCTSLWWLLCAFFRNNLWWYVMSYKLFHLYFLCSQSCKSAPFVHLSNLISSGWNLVMDRFVNNLPYMCYMQDPYPYVGQGQALRDWWNAATFRGILYILWHLGLVLFSLSKHTLNKACSCIKWRTNLWSLTVLPWVTQIWQWNHGLKLAMLFLTHFN